MIQRVPNGLLAVLGMKGIDLLPQDLAQQAVGVLELLQYYGLSQRQSASANNAAAVEGAAANVIVLSDVSWTVLFGAESTIIKTGTMTAARLMTLLTRGAPSGIALASDDMGPFGATETGPATLPYFAPYPILCPPGTAVRNFLQILGTDANANVTLAVEFGLLG